MPSDQDSEREYFRQRIRELRHEIAEGEYALGVPVNDQTLPAILQDVVDALRRTGNPSLADRLTSAYTRFDEADSKLERLNREGVVDEGARDAINEMLEHFERVEADAKVWLDAAGGAR